MKLTSVFRTISSSDDDQRHLFKKHYDAAKLADAIEALMRQNREELRTCYRGHALQGNWKGYREIHLEGDCLLIYRVKHSELLLVLTRTGSHDDLF